MIRPTFSVDLAVAFEVKHYGLKVGLIALPINGRKMQSVVALLDVRVDGIVMCRFLLPALHEC